MLYQRTSTFTANRSCEVVLFYFQKILKENYVATLTLFFSITKNECQEFPSNIQNNFRMIKKLKTYIKF